MNSQDNLSSQDLLAAIVESTDDAIVSEGINGIVTIWNKGAERIFGYSSGEIIGKPAALLVSSDRSSEMAAILKRVYKGEHISHCEMIRQRRDGLLINVSLTISPVRNRDGIVVGAYQVIRERERHRSALRGEERFRVTLASIGDGVIATDANGLITFMNPVAESLTGWTEAEALGRLIEEVFRILNEFTRGSAENPVRRVLRENEIVTLSHHTVLIAKNGPERPIDETAAPIRDDSGNLAGAVLVFRDVSERKAAQFAIKRLAAIVDSSEDAIVSKTLRGVIVSWNRGAERMFGYSAVEVIGKPVTVLIPPERHAEETAILERLSRGERIEHYETQRVTKSGRPINVALSVSPLRDPEGRIIGASKIVRDITERKRTELELETARKRLEAYATGLEDEVRQRTASLQEAVSDLEAFSYTVSHDLRTPLRAIQQYSRIIWEDHGVLLDPDIKGYLERIAKAARRMDQLILDLLDYSRVSRSLVRLGSVDTEKLVLEAIEQNLSLQPTQADVEVVRPLSSVRGHEVFLAQCLSNLLNNAAKFVPENRKPRIRIWTEEFSSRVRIWIQDNGIGIHPKDQSRIFGLLERVENGGSYEGTGFGLAIVRKAVERMEGSVGVESVPGEGSRFWVQLAKP